MPDLVKQADERLTESEGFGFERLVGALYEERSRKGLGEFALSARIEGYWDRSDIEIDLVAIDELSEQIRFGTCKRSAAKLGTSLATLDRHVEAFMREHPRYAGWKVERVALAPKIDDATRSTIITRGFIAQDLADLTAGL